MAANFQLHKNSFFFKALHFLLVLFVFCRTTNGQGFLKRSGERIVNGKGENVLLCGIGLGGWMLQEGYMLRVNGGGQQHKIRERIEELVGPKKTQEFYDAWLANGTRKIDIDSLKAWGFNSVRLPMHYGLYTLPVEKEKAKGENTWLQKGFALTDSLLAWCKANKMYLILDMHATPGGQGNDLNISDRDSSKPSLWQSPDNQQKLVQLWRKLAERYRNEEWIGAYDIINEPNWGFQDLANDRNGLKEQKNEPLRNLMIEITKAIREVDKNHLIIIEGNGWGNNYNGILPVWDANMALSFHKYWNYNDPASIAHILKYREQNRLPVWLGETGENSNVWFTQAIQLLEQNNIGWAWWPLKKMGANNPIEIPSNPNYQKILDYWSGKGQKPKASDAYSSLLELASSAKLENAILHKDVIDAMFRQPFSLATKPFRQHRLSAKTTIPAVDYDLGRNGFAYYDLDTADYHISGQSGVGNKGRVYRNDGVDIRKDSAAFNSYYVSDMEKSEWLQYTVQVPKKGRYSIKLQLAVKSNGGKLSLWLNGNAVAKEIAVQPGNINQRWKLQDMGKLSLNAGVQVIRVYADEGSFELKAIEISAK